MNATKEADLPADESIKAQIVKDKLWVQWQGRIYALSLAKPKHGAANETESQDLIAPFPCKIVKLHVSSGQSVALGDPVVSVEAMKMEYTYTSPREGRIKQVNVEVGKIVPEGTHFVDWEKA